MVFIQAPYHPTSEGVLAKLSKRPYHERSLENKNTAAIYAGMHYHLSGGGEGLKKLPFGLRYSLPYQIEDVLYTDGYRL